MIGPSHYHQKLRNISLSDGQDIIKIYMKFNKTSMSIHKYVVCACPSPNFCYGNCGENSDNINCELVKGDIEGNNIKYSINNNITDQTLWEPMSKKIIPVMIKYQEIYDEYFRIYDGNTQ